MKFLPFENITFKTILNEDEITNRLKNFIESEKFFRGGLCSCDSVKQYEGVIKNKTFKIKEDLL